jgi:hypothetical protein
MQGHNGEDVPHTVHDPRPSIRFSPYALHEVRHDVRNLTTLRQHDLLIDRGLRAYCPVMLAPMPRRSVGEGHLHGDFYLERARQDHGWSASPPAAESRRPSGRG